jgi:DNA-binding HxlR family transcriptional regulator
MLVSTLSRHGFTDGILPAGCNTRTVLDHVTSKWGVLVLVALTEQTLRWGELRRVVEGVSEKMLAQTLKTLESDGFVLRDAHPVIPPRVEYSLTERGRELADRLLPLMDWIADNADAIIPGAAPAS